MGEDIALEERGKSPRSKSLPPASWQARQVREPAPDPVDQALGAALRQLRKSRRVSMAALARHLGLSYQQIQKYERGDNRMVASLLFRIADFFGTDVGDLFASVSAMRERATSSRLVVLTMPRDTIRQVPEQELVDVMSNYSKICDESVRDGVSQLIERLAVEPCPGQGPLNGAHNKWESP